MKKKLNRFLKITIMIIAVVLAYSTVVSAYSFTPTMTPSATTVQEATEFTVTVKITNLDLGPNGINAFSAKLDYDTNVFEPVTASGVEGLSGWAATYEPDKKTIALSKLQYAKTEENIFQITLKTKSGVIGKTGTIKLTEVTAADQSTLTNAQDVSTSIAVGSATTNTPSSSTNNVPSISAVTNSKNNNTINNNIVNNTANKVNNVANDTNKVNNIANKVGTASKEDIPYTGVEDDIIKAIFVVMAIALIFYIKFEKINKEMK